MTTLGVFRDDVYNPIGILPAAQFKSTTQNGGTLSAANLSGAQENYLAASGNTGAQALTTDTAANIIANVASQLQAKAVGFQPNATNLLNLVFLVTIINNNTSSGAITLTGGTGVTITGTATIAITVSRQYLATITGPNTVTFQNVGSGTP